jgi:ElaB/YqjD/DUF883 family membrane-anchored ribosome-binding protein
MSDEGVQGQGSSHTEQLREKALEAGQNLREAGGHVREAAREQIGHLRERAGDMYEQGRAKAKQWEEGLESYVQEKPLKSLLIAAGVGLFLGIFWKRR